jgi:hypothetical protein
MNMTSQQAKPHPHLVRLLVKLMMNGAFLFSHLPKIPSQNAGSNVGYRFSDFLTEFNTRESPPVQSFHSS